MASRQAVLGIDQGAFYHGTRKIFSDVSFLLDDAATALVGENGVGKSTLLNCLSGRTRTQLRQDRPLPRPACRLLCRRMCRPAWTGSPCAGAGALASSALARAGEDWRIDMLLDEIGVSAETADGLFGDPVRRLAKADADRRSGAPRSPRHPHPRRADQSPRHRPHQRPRALADCGLPPADADRLPRPGVPQPGQHPHPVPAPDGIHAFKTSFALAREELLRRDAAAGVRRKIEEKEIKRLEKVAARYHVWGQQNPNFHRRKKAVETRIEHIREGHGPRSMLPVSAAWSWARVKSRPRSLCAWKVCDLMTPDGARKLLDVDRLAIARRRQGGSAGRQRRRANPPCFTRLVAGLGRQVGAL